MVAVLSQFAEEDKPRRSYDGAAGLGTLKSGPNVTRSSARRKRPWRLVRFWVVEVEQPRPDTSPLH
jgi:hypothetical protein